MCCKKAISRCLVLTALLEYIHRSSVRWPSKTKLQYFSCNHILAAWCGRELQSGFLALAEAATDVTWRSNKWSQVFASSSSLVYISKDCRWPNVRFAPNYILALDAHYLHLPVFSKNSYYHHHHQGAYRSLRSFMAMYGALFG